MMEKHFEPEVIASKRLVEKGEKDKYIANVGYFEQGGQILARDLQIVLDGKHYSLEVGTQAYVDSLAKLDPPLEEDYATLVMKDVTNLEAVYNSLRKLPKNKLLPHLHLQEEEITTPKKSKQKLPTTNFQNPNFPSKDEGKMDEFYKPDNKGINNTSGTLKLTRRQLYRPKDK